MDRVTRRWTLGSLGALLTAPLFGSTSVDAQADSVWPMFGYDPQNTSSSPSVGPKRAVSETWALEADDAVQSAATVTEDVVYVGSDDGGLYAIDRSDGTEQWVFRTDGSVSGAPAAVDGTVYVGSTDATLYALDTAARETRWTYETGGGIEAAPTVTDGTVYVGSDDNSLHAVDIDDGTAIWTFETGGIITSTPAVADGTVYVGSADGSVYAVDATSGTERWSYATDNGVNSSPAVAAGTVYVSSSDGHLYALDAATGERSWRFPLEGLGGTSPAVADGAVYVTEGVQGTRIHALDADTGERRWSGETGASVRSSPAVADGVVYVTSTDSYVYAIETTEGDLLWRLSPGDSITASPTVVDDTVYVGSTDGSLYALRGTTTSPDPTATAASTPTATTRALGPSGETGDGGFPLLPTALGAAGLGGGGLWWYRARSDPGGSEGGGAEEPAVSPDTGGGESPDPSPGPNDPRARDRGEADGATENGPATPDPPMSPADRTAESGGEVSDPGSVSIDGERREPDRILAVPKASFAYDDFVSETQISERDTGTITRATVETASGPLTVAVARPRLTGTVGADELDRLLTEAETWQKLDDHDHIVTVIAYGGQPLPWIAMEYMDGGDLSDRTDDIGLLQATWTAISVINAVYHAHRRGVHHLHLKPGNVLFQSTEGSWDVPKVSDWWRGSETARDVTGPALRYAAPEQIDDAYGPLDDLTDVYQVGAVLYELFTGRPPFDETVENRARASIEAEPNPPSDVADVPAALDDILLTALATEKADRYDSLVYLRDALVDLYEQ
ncbi:PQQ-binding-like beta-propeller repeat protein [Halobellus salinisoli]|uniref:outer membrane protein assembly factor BamB family protein n=1 Tax=Halobellus salinisoli TaxID=3108500 RepID=UPI00300BBD60